MGRGRRANAKGRSTGPAPFLMLPQWAFDSPAYRTLKPGPRALLWELIRRFNGTNNGHIVFSQRDMAVAINVTDRETVALYVRELESRGLIVASRRGGFNVKVADRRASEWALTWLPVGDVPATKAFMRWYSGKIGGTEKPAARGGFSAPAHADRAVQVQNVRDFPSHYPIPERQMRAENPPTYTSLAIGTMPLGAERSASVSDSALS